MPLLTPEEPPLALAAGSAVAASGAACATRRLPPSRRGCGSAACCWCRTAWICCWCCAGGCILHSQRRLGGEREHGRQRGQPAVRDWVLWRRADGSRRQRNRCTSPHGSGDRCAAHLSDCSPPSTTCEGCAATRAGRAPPSMWFCIFNHRGRLPLLLCRARNAPSCCQTEAWRKNMLP